MDFLADLEVSALPGVGYHTAAKIAKLGSEVRTVRQLRGLPKELLLRHLGPKAGQVRAPSPREPYLVHPLAN